MCEALQWCGMYRHAHRQIFVDASIKGNIALSALFFDHLDSADEDNTSSKPPTNTVTVGTP